MARTAFRLALAVKKIIIKYAKMLIGKRRIDCILYDLNNMNQFTSLAGHEGMLADSVRVEGYYRGIQRNVRPGDIVVDLGTGTGILSFFASKRNPEKIYAIDHSPFISIAQAVARNNSIENIEFVRMHSKEFSPEEKVDVILHEQLGAFLFNENMIENLLDLKKRVLKPSGRILPAKFELFVEPIVLKEEFRIPFLWEREIHGIDFSFLKNHLDLGQYKKSDYLFKSRRNLEIDYLMAEPDPILFLDLNEIVSEEEIPRSFTARRSVVRSGVIDGYCMYFRVIFDEEISFDNSPVNRQTNWWNVVFRCERRKYNVGDMIHYTFHMEDLANANLWYVKTEDDVRSGAQVQIQKRQESISSKLHSIRVL